MLNDWMEWKVGRGGWSGRNENANKDELEGWRLSLINNDDF